MPEDDPTSLLALLEFLYTCDYTLRPATTTASHTQLVSHAKVYTVADKYCLPHLQQLAKEKFVDAACAVLSQASKNNGASASIDRILDFLAAIEYLYTATPASTASLDLDAEAAEADASNTTLQYEAVSLAKQYSPILFNRRSGADTLVYERARALLHDYPEFAVDMALLSSASAATVGGYRLVLSSNGNGKGNVFERAGRKSGGRGSGDETWTGYRLDGVAAR